MDTAPLCNTSVDLDMIGALLQCEHAIVFEVLCGVVGLLFRYFAHQVQKRHWNNKEESSGPNTVGVE